MNSHTFILRPFATGAAEKRLLSFLRERASGATNKGAALRRFL